MGKILIKNGQVWDGEHFFYADVLTNGKFVEKIGTNITDDTAYVYDASGKIVSAGLVDAHVHMLVDPSDEYGIQAEMSCFPFGVTAAADAGRKIGNPAILDSFMLKNVIFISTDIHENHVDLATLNNIIERFGNRVVGVKVYFDEKMSEVEDVTPLREVCEFAKKRNLRVMVHCSNSPVSMSDILSTLNKGDILTHAYHGGLNNASEDNFESIKSAQERGVIIDAGFAGNVHTNFDVFKRAMANNALPDTISTDITKFSAFVRGGRYGMTMCMSLARYEGMQEEDIFRAVTSNPAKVLGKEEKWGYLKEGRIADIAVFDYTEESFSLSDNEGNHVESKKGYRCILTISDGQIVYKD